MSKPSKRVISPNFYKNEFSIMNGNRKKQKYNLMKSEKNTKNFSIRFHLRSQSTKTLFSCYQTLSTN